MNAAARIGTCLRKAASPALRLLAAVALAVLAATVVAASPATALETTAKQAILLDLSTGAVLFEKNADERVPPSSMSKLMTVYMVFEDLKSGRLKLDDTLPVSRKAWRMGGSKMFVLVDKRVRVEDLLKGIIIQSGNDACVVVAEGLAGSEKAFAEAMTRRARELGLKRSVFRNATGWPDPEHLMTVREIAEIARLTIENFPEYYHYYSEKSFTYGGISQRNRNPLLSKKVGADGLKTGHTVAAGFGLVASAMRDGRRLILVVNGLDGERVRARESERLIEWGFREFRNYTLVKAGETVEEAEVWLGQAKVVPLVAESDLVVTLSRQGRRGMKAKVLYEGPLPAPIERGQRLARLVVTAPGSRIIESPLVAGEAVAEVGFFGRLGMALGELIAGTE